MLAAWHAPDAGWSGVLKPGRFSWLAVLAWMVGLFLLMAIVDVALVGIVIGGEQSGAGPIRTLVVAVGAIAALGAYAGLVRLVERRRPNEMALAPAPAELGLGLLLGAAIMAATVGALVLVGAYRYVDAPQEPAWSAVQMSLASGVVEEIIARAVVLRLVMRAFGAGWGIGVSAALFGLLHLPNPDASLFAALAIAVEAGVLLGALYLLTGRIWASIGAHASWNFMQGYVFGADVSGAPLRDTLLTFAPVATAPDLVSGGAFGPEASLPAVIIASAVGAGVLWAAWRRGHLRRGQVMVSPDADVTTPAPGGTP